MSQSGERRAAPDRDRASGPSPFERFVEAAYLRVSRAPFFFFFFFFFCVALIVALLVSVPLWADLKEWQVVIHSVTSVITLLLIALLANAGRRSEEAAQEKVNMLAEALMALMESPGDRLVERSRVLGGQGRASGSQSSTALPSGSRIQANLPAPASVVTSPSSGTPAAWSC